MQRGPGEHQELPGVALGDGAALVPEQHGGRLVYLVVVHLVEADTSGLPPVKVAANTPPPLRPLQPVLADVGAPDGDVLPSRDLDLVHHLLVLVEHDEPGGLGERVQDAGHVVPGGGDLLQGVAAGRAGGELSQPHARLASGARNNVKTFSSEKLEAV